MGEFSKRTVREDSVEEMLASHIRLVFDHEIALELDDEVMGQAACDVVRREHMAHCAVCERTNRWWHNQPDEHAGAWDEIIEVGCPHPRRLHTVKRMGAGFPTRSEFFKARGWPRLNTKNLVETMPRVREYWDARNAWIVSTGVESIETGLDIMGRPETVLTFEEQPGQVFLTPASFKRAVGSIRNAN